MSDIQSLIERIRAWHNKHGGPRSAAASKLLLEANTALEAMEKEKICAEMKAERYWAEFAEERRKREEADRALAMECADHRATREHWKAKYEAARELATTNCGTESCAHDDMDECLDSVNNQIAARLKAKEEPKP